jgi:hypothetical protein
MNRFRFIPLWILLVGLFIGTVGLASPVRDSNLIAVGTTIHIQNLPEGQTWEGIWRETAKRQKADPDKTRFLVVGDQETALWLQEKAGVWDGPYSLPEVFVSANSPRNLYTFDKEGDQLPPPLKEADISGRFNIRGARFSLAAPGVMITGKLTIPKGSHGPGGTFDIRLPQLRVKSADFIIVPLADPKDRKIRYLLSFQIRVADARP